MSIPSSLPVNPILARLEKELKKAHGEIEYWVRNHADAIEDLAKKETDHGRAVVELEKQVKELECKLKEKE